MEGYLLDTNVVSETRKTHADPGVVAFLSGADNAKLFLSVLTLGELRKGVVAQQSKNPAFAKQLAAWVDGIETIFIDRLLPVDAAVAARWGELSGGQILPVIDTLIAATALVHGLMVVTRNTKDFAATSVAFVNPFEVPA
jgi:predicted nucleic acid-binding protein